MKILKEGNGQNWTMEILCDITKDKYGLAYDPDIEHCGSLLEIDKDDIEYKAWTKFELDGHDYIVRCPKCKSRLYINPKLIPEYIKLYVRNKYKEQE